MAKTSDLYSNYRDFPGLDSELPMHGAQVPSLVREPDPTHQNEDQGSHMSQLRPRGAK